MIIYSSLNLRFGYIRCFSEFTKCFPKQLTFLRPIESYFDLRQDFSRFSKLNNFHLWTCTNPQPSQIQSIANLHRLKTIKSTNLIFNQYSMPRILNVAEKPDAAKTISQILSQGQSNRVCVTYSYCFYFICRYYSIFKNHFNFFISAKVSASTIKYSNSNARWKTNVVSCWSLLY